MTFHNTETSAQNRGCNQKQTALGRNEDKTSSSTELFTNWCQPSMSGSTAPDQGMELAYY